MVVFNNESFLKQNKRTANLLIVTVSNTDGHFSKSSNLATYCAKKFTEQSLSLIKSFNKTNNDQDIQDGDWLVNFS